MKKVGILKFDLEEYDSRLAHKRAVSADDAYSLLIDIQTVLRRWNDCFMSSDHERMIHDICKLIAESPINTDDLP